MPANDYLNRSMDLANHQQQQSPLKPLPRTMRFNASISDQMNATFNASYLGLIPQSNAYIAVMEAKFEKEQKKL